MDRRVWRAKARGGYTRVLEIVDGREVGEPISVNGKRFGEQLAHRLNEAYAAGVADQRADIERAERNRIADMLEEDDFLGAADAVRQSLS